MEVTQPVFDYAVILRHSNQARLLLLQAEQGWSLPHWQTTTRYLWQSVLHIHQTVSKLFGADVTVLRFFEEIVDRERLHYLNFYELENHDPTWQPPQNARWVDQAEFTQLALVQSELRPVIENWFKQETRVPVLRRAWARVGWFDRATSWITAQAEQHGLQLKGKVEQLRTWERSCLLRVDSSQGWLYFKALPAWFAHELAVLALLTPTFTHSLPQLIATDPTHDWMLMSDFGGESLDMVADPQKWAEALQGYATMQQFTANRQSELLAAGCHNRSLKAMVAYIDPFLQELDVYTNNRWSRLTQAEIAQLSAKVPQLKSFCQTLDSYNLPLTIEHGDFWPTNVIATNNRFLYYDWSDCSLSHPFFSLLLFLHPDNLSDETVKNALELQGDWQRYLRQAYLQSWKHYEPLERLEAACDLALKLAPLHHAMLYHYQILPNMEMRWELESMVVFYLKMLL